MKRTNILGILGAATLLSGVAFSAAPSITATASPAQQNVRLLVNKSTKVVTANGLNVRAKASVNSSRLGILPKGSKVEVVGQEGNWSKIMYNGKVAYVASSYLAKGTSGASTSQAKPQGTSQKAKVVTANGLNVRAKASVNSSRLGILPKGSKVEVIGQEGNWSKIMYNGKVAYVASSYLANGISGASTSQVKPQGTSKKEKVVIANGLNVRAKASVNSSKLGILPKGLKVEVIGQEGNWSKIMYNGKVAYIASSYLANGTSGASTSQVKPQGTSKKEKVVIANGLNVRAKASVNSSKLGILPKGSKIEVMGQQGNWAKIMYNGKTAFVSMTYLK